MPGVGVAGGNAFGTAGGGAHGECEHEDTVASE